MQIIDKDKILQCHHEGDRMLFELINGSFQYGTGIEAQIITDLEEVSMFSKAVQAKVKAWLERSGPVEAKKDKNAILLAEQATKTGPGVLDAMVDQLGPEMKGEIVSLFKSFLESFGKLPAKSPEAVQDLGTGKLVVNENGNREFIPDESALDDVIRREMELDAKIAAGQVDEPDTADLVGAGVGAEESSFAKDIAKAKPVRRK